MLQYLVMKPKVYGREYWLSQQKCLKNPNPTGIKFKLTGIGISKILNSAERISILSITLVNYIETKVKNAST